jgi:hypothetical protein
MSDEAKSVREWIAVSTSVMCVHTRVCLCLCLYPLSCPQKHETYLRFHCLPSEKHSDEHREKLQATWSAETLTLDHPHTTTSSAEQEKHFKVQLGLIQASDEHQDRHRRHAVVSGALAADLLLSLVGTTLDCPLPFVSSLSPFFRACGQIVPPSRAHTHSLTHENSICSCQVATPAKHCVHVVRRDMWEGGLCVFVANGGRSFPFLSTRASFAQFLCVSARVSPHCSPQFLSR